MIEHRPLHGHVVNVIEPEPGETIVVRTDFLPFFLGFARWSKRRLTAGSQRRGVIVSEELGSGVCWRGFGAKCVDKLIREEQGR